MTKFIPVLTILVLCIWSMCSLAFYRSEAYHAPDKVGEEVSRFLIPLVLALLVSVGYLCVAKWRMKNNVRSALIVLVSVFVIMVLEVGVYTAFILR